MNTAVPQARHAEREVVIQRVFDAPARLLFLAWPLTHCEMEFKVGGHFRFGMTGPDGTQTPRFCGQYLEIVANEKIV